MLRLRRDVILASAAIVVGALAFGPHLYDVSRPFPDAIAARGGTWRTVLDSTGTPYRVVVHHIPQYCYSPGIGAISEVRPGSADSLFRTANTIAAALRPDHEIVPTWADYRAGRDPVLEWILHSTNRSRVPDREKPTGDQKPPPNKRLRLAARVGY